MHEDIGQLKEPFYCKKRDKIIKSSFEIDCEFCVICPYINEEDLSKSECEVVRNAKVRYIDDEGNIISEEDLEQ